MKQISREEHFKAVEKWKEAVRKTENGEKFLPVDGKRPFGFKDLIIWVPCSYCIHFGPCCNCPLSQVKRGSEVPICNSDLYHISHVEQFVSFMIEGKSKNALAHGKKVLERLNEITKELGYE